jgi:CRP-like cAMP-binding protein
MHRLADIQLLRGVEEESLKRVQEAGEIISVPAGERIIEEGAVPQNLVLLISGKLEVFVPDPADRSRGNRLATIIPGDSCGEYGFIDRRPASASVKAVENSEVFLIANTDFDALMRQNHELERNIYRNLLSTLVNRLRASNVVIDVLRAPRD